MTDESKRGAAGNDAISGGMEAALTPGLSLIERLQEYDRLGNDDQARDLCREAANELSKDSRDAARYRWLRSEEVATSPLFYPFWQEFHVKLCREEAMDALIDSAMTSRVKVPK